MNKVLDVGLPSVGQPFSWAVASGDLLFTTHGPVTSAGRILEGSAAEQADLTLQHFRTTAIAAGGTMEDYVQVQIFLTDAADVAAVDEVYQRYFTPPYPNRATVIVAGLVAPGMKVEISGIARINAQAEHHPMVKEIGRR